MKRLHFIGIAGAIIATTVIVALHRQHPTIGELPEVTRQTRTSTSRLSDPDPGSVPVNVTALRLAGGKKAEVDAWLATLDPPARDEALSIMAAELGRSDPQRAEYEARRISDPLIRREIVSLSLAYRFDQDPQAALAILRDETDPSLKSAISARLLPALADTDARAAASLLAEGGTGEDDITPLVAATVQHWAAQNAPAAATWLTGIEDDSLRQSATTALVGEWGRRDRPGLERWLDQRPEAADFQSAYLDWRDPWSPQQWEDWTNQVSAAKEGSISDSSGILSGTEGGEP